MVQHTVPSSMMPRRVARLSRRSLRRVPLSGGARGWRSSSLVGLGLMSWVLVQVNGPLVASAGLGWLTYRQLHQLTPQQWEHISQTVARLGVWSVSRRQKALILSGALTTSLYMMLALWQTTQSFGAAAALTGQTALSLWIVGLLLRPKTSLSPLQAPSAAVSAEPIQQFEADLQRLGHPDALQRLMAVRRLMRQVCGDAGDQRYGTLGEVTLRSHLTDCLRLLLAHESEPLVREAIKQALHGLNPPAQLAEGAPAVSLERPPRRSDKDPQKLSRPIRRTVVEYVEP